MENRKLSLSYEVVIPEGVSNVYHGKYSFCKPDSRIQVIISPFVIIPFTKSCNERHGGGHLAY